MTCKKCQTLLSDDTVVCPICGMPTVRRKSKQRSLLGLSAIGTDLLTLAMTLVHTYLLATAAHYATDLSQGLWYAKQVAYWFAPLLLWLDILFGILLLAFPILSVIARYQMSHSKKSGLILITVVHAALLVWSICYPLFSYLLTGLVSPVLTFCIWQIAIFSVASAIMLFYLWRSEQFVL